MYIQKESEIERKIIQFETRKEIQLYYFSPFLPTGWIFFIIFLLSTNYTIGYDFIDFNGGISLKNTNPKNELNYLLELKSS